MCKRGINLIVTGVLELLFLKILLSQSNFSRNLIARQW